jgi:hypothetical protein
MFKHSLWVYAISFFPGIVISCSGDSAKNRKKEQPKTIVAKPYDTIPRYRALVKKEPVDSYQEKTENPLNDWYFRVRIYETPNTFHYLLKLEYEEIRGQDTLRIPNFGIPPRPVIKKGKEKYSCIIGFLDKNNEFREYKKVFVKNNTLKVTTIKQYSVATYWKEK